MTQQEINEGNALIAEFMGYVKSGSDQDFTFYRHPDGKGIVIQSDWNYKVFDTHALMEIRGFLFYRNWNWLIQVIQCIVPPYGWEVELIKYQGDLMISLQYAQIEPVWKACVNFIKQYNHEHPR